MAASTVNIADFRCRGLKGHSTDPALRAAKNPGGLRIVEPQPAAEEREHGVNAHGSAGEDSSVLDISAARDEQHMQRVVLRPALTSRSRSNLVRFNEPRVTVMKVKKPYAMQSWAQRADDYDHPPAA
jgi:hypothetical protein